MLFRDKRTLSSLHLGVSCLGNKGSRRVFKIPRTRFLIRRADLFVQRRWCRCTLRITLQSSVVWASACCRRHSGHAAAELAEPRLRLRRELEPLENNYSLFVRWALMCGALLFS